jgi:hypothetical protein
LYLNRQSGLTRFLKAAEAARQARRQITQGLRFNWFTEASPQPSLGHLAATKGLETGA